MMTGEVAPGGVGSGLYGILVLAIIAVFVAGLMVGRTPEYLGKKIQAREIKLASLYILATPAVRADRHRARHGAARRTGRRCSTPARTGCPRCSTRSPRRRTTTAPRSPASASTRVWYNTALGLAMLLARFLPIIFVLGARRLARPAAATCPSTAGTLPTHRPLFVGLLLGVIVIVVRAHLLPGARARTARGRAALMSTAPPSTAPRRRPVAGGLLDPKQLLTSLPDAARKLDPRVMWHNPVMLDRRDRRGAHDGPRDQATRGVRLVDRRLAVAHGRLRQPRRGRRRGPRQGAGRDPAPHEDRRPSRAASSAGRPAPRRHVREEEVAGRRRCGSATTSSSRPGR